MSNFLTELEKLKREDGSLAQPRGSSFMQALNEIRDNDDNYQSLPQQGTQGLGSDNETTVHRGLRELGVPDWLNDYLFEPYIRYGTNFALGLGDTFIRGALNVPALISRGIGIPIDYLIDGESIFTSAANLANDVDQKYAEASQNYRNFITDNKQGLLDEGMHGFGTSIGYMALGGLTAKKAAAAGLGHGISAMLGYLAKNASEAVTEAANTTSDLYAQDKTRGNDAFLGGLYSLAANAPLDIGHSIVGGGLEGIMNAFLPTKVQSYG